MNAVMEAPSLTIDVKKRNGELVRFDAAKIERTINWSVRNLPVDVSILLNDVFEQLYDGISTEAIQNVLINTSLKLTTSDEPDWRIVAGRLKMLDLYKRVNRLRGGQSLTYGDYPTLVHEFIARGLYTDQLTQKYSDDELREAGTYIDERYDMDFDFAGVNLMINRYLIQEGAHIVELPQEALLTMSLLLNQNETIDIRMKRVKKTYEQLAQRKISLATPILINLRRPSGNLSSCFLVSADDSLESIYYVIETCAMISKEGGGVGTDWSRVRAKGSAIKGIPNVSGGVLPWLKVINDTAVAVNQQGKRAGSITVALDIWHYDIEEFLELQTENGDQRRKAFDLFPQIVVLDEFMRRVETHGDWYMFDPHEIRTKFGYELAELWGENFDRVYRELEQTVVSAGAENDLYLNLLDGQEFDKAYRDLVETMPNKNRKIELVKKVKARDLMKHMMRTQLETGLPYIAFKDAINRNNPNKDSGYIPAVNLCVESYSNVKPAKVKKSVLENGQVVRRVEGGENHTCNLLSLNLANLLTGEELEESSREAVRILDNTIEITTPPVHESYIHNQRYRTVGIGAMGYADYVAWKGVPYQRSIELADELFENIAYYTFDESANLAKERGTFGAYKESEFAKGKILSRNMDWYRENTKDPERWEKLFAKIAQHGMRNSQLLAIAPNTSTAMVQGATASVLPVFSRFFLDSNGKGSTPIVPPYLKEKRWFYLEFKNIDQKDYINVISTMQKWIDTGISMELIFNLNQPHIDALYIYETIMHAWKRGSKAIYYVRTIQKDGSIADKEECDSCAG